MALETRLKRFDRALTDLGIRVRDANDRKIWGSCLDEETLRALYKLAHRRVVGAYGGPIKTGKEANVFHALSPAKGELAVKIFRTATSEFRDMEAYLSGDRRFKTHSKDRRDLVQLWARREFKNLELAMGAGARVPAPIALERNILVMEFVGVEEMAAPTLKEVAFDLTPEEGAETLEKTLEAARRLHQRAELVHADLSEYNILYFGGPVLIDFGQAVPRDHPRAEEFLKRDAARVARFFSRWRKELSEEAVLKQILEPFD